MVERYIPELQSLCSREIAKNMRKMTDKERYNEMKKIPEHLNPYITAFPLNFFTWCVDESLFNIKLIRHYIDFIKDRKYIVNSYEKDCETGITRRTPISRKCVNYYCENMTFGKMIRDHDSLRFLCCDECKQYMLKIPEWLKIRKRIEGW